MQTHHVLSMPSNPSDPRFRLPRSPDCPNDISTEEQPGQVSITPLSGKAGMCGLCAWGFYDMSSAEHQTGEPLQGLTLTPIQSGSDQAGYKAQCGRVKLYRDQDGRMGAVRRISGEDRFFPGKKGNWAYERYLREHPEVAMPQFEAA